MKSPLLFGVALTCLVSPLVAHAAIRPACSAVGESRGKLLVPDEQTAVAIFLAVERKFKPDANRIRFPSVKAEDEGANWAVFRWRPPHRTLFGTEVTYGGGQLSMSIRKCDATISGVHLTE